MDEHSKKDGEEAARAGQSEKVRNKGKGAPPQADSGVESSREESFSRRALIRAGWSVPVIMAVTPPRAYAQGSPLPGHVDSGGHSDVVHGDGIHSDIPHTDGGMMGGHSDIVPVPHADTPPSHSDIPHTDGGMMGGHSDTVPHGDTPPSHSDVAHSDVPHADS